MNLNKLFKDAPSIKIEQLSIDSRLPMKNCIFFCLNGIKYDGHDYIDEAIENGAKVIVHSKDVDTSKNAIYIKVKNVNETIKRVGNIFYNYPNDDIDEYVVSGCYGRSTVSSIIQYYLNSFSKCGYVGIFGIRYADTILSTSFPALTSLENFKTINRMKNDDVKHCVFETSSISLYYKKLDVLKPDVFVYTNTSRLCSDYLACNNMYFSNIRKYLYTLEESTYVVLNKDDESFLELKDSISNYVTYGTDYNSTYRISDILIKNDGLEFIITFNKNEYLVKSKLLGKVNVYNIAAAIVALHTQGYDIENIIEIISNMPQIEGVYESINDDYRIIVDCAYETDSVENIFKFAKETSEGKVICVLGINCNDDDARINELMRLTNLYIDRLILTEDESLDKEVMNILARCDKYNNNSLHISLRSRAIENGINIMNKKDTLLIIGKGSEKYLTMSLGKERYDGDKHYALKYLKKRIDEENTLEI